MSSVIIHHLACRNHVRPHPNFPKKTDRKKRENVEKRNGYETCQTREKKKEKKRIQMIIEVHMRRMKNAKFYLRQSFVLKVKHEEKEESFVKVERMCHRGPTSK